MITLIIDLLTLTVDNGFDLADALDPNNDIGGKEKNKGQGGGWECESEQVISFCHLIV